jgi:hypothetical protein
LLHRLQWINLNFDIINYKVDKDSKNIKIFTYVSNRFEFSWLKFYCDGGSDDFQMALSLHKDLERPSHTSLKDDILWYSVYQNIRSENFSKLK